MMPLLREEYFGIKTFSPTLIKKKSPIYVITTINPKKQQTFAIKKSVPSGVLDRLDHFNRGLMNYFTDGIQPTTTPNLEESSSTRDFIRIYVTKGLSTLNECIQNPSAVAVIMGNMHFFRKERCFRFSVLIARPFGRMHDLETLEFSDLNDAKGWVRCVVLARRDGIELSMKTRLFSKLLPYSISKFDENSLSPDVYNAFIKALWNDEPNVARTESNEESFLEENDEHPEFEANNGNETSNSSLDDQVSPSNQNIGFLDNAKSLKKDTVVKGEISPFDVSLPSENQPLLSESLVSGTSSSAKPFPYTRQVTSSLVVKEEVNQVTSEEPDALDDSNDQVQTNSEWQDESLIVETSKKKRHRRTQRETYAYLNQLPKRRTRQQSQSEWNLLAESAASSPSTPKTQIGKSQEENHLKSSERNRIRSRGGSIMSRESNGRSDHRGGSPRGIGRGRGRGRGRNVSRVVTGTRRSERQASKKVKIEFVNEYGLVTHIETEEVHERVQMKESSNGNSDGGLMELDQPTTENEDEKSSISSEVLSEDDKESDVGGSSNSRAVTNPQTPEPKGLWQTIRSTLFGWSPFGSGR